jgi:hypothetical protein
MSGIYVIFISSIFHSDTTKGKWGEKSSAERHEKKKTLESENQF